MGDLGYQCPPPDGRMLARKVQGWSPLVQEDKGKEDSQSSTVSYHTSVITHRQKW